MVLHRLIIYLKLKSHFTLSLCAGLVALKVAVAVELAATAAVAATLGRDRAVHACVCARL